MKLTELRYTIEHITGEDNVWADMASRWAGAAPPAVSTVIKRWQVDDGEEPLQLRHLGPDSEWPKLQDIVEAQCNSNCTRPPQLVEGEDGGEM